MAFQNKELSVIAYANGFTLWQVDEMHDKTLATSVVDNRYERDGKWRGLK